MRLLALTLSAVTLASATAAVAQPAVPAASLQDARCLLAMVALSNATDANAQKLGQSGVIYFTGRISARDPNFNFASLKSLASTMNVQAAQTDLQQRCGPMFEQSMKQLETALAAPPGAAPPAAAQPAPPRK
jgi:hypothetical protein